MGTRLGAAISLAASGALAMFAALAAHEILSFGASGHGLIDRAGCPVSICPTLPIVLTGLAFKAIGAGLAIGLLALLVTAEPARHRAAALLWSAQYLWALIGIASAYRAEFGATWRWWEPFVALMFHPVLTPALLLAGLALFAGADRALRRA